MRSRDQRPAVGERWLVKWRDGSTHLAEVIEVREAKGGRAPAGVQDYYVHYVGHDRRLDEWAPEARVCVDKGVQLAEEPSEGQGSGRRGHKRRRGRAVSESVFPIFVSFFQSPWKTPPRRDMLLLLVYRGYRTTVGTDILG